MGTGAISLVSWSAQAEDSMRKGLIMKATNESTFLRILNFVPVHGLSYEYGTMVKLPGVGFRAINQGYTPDSGVVNPSIERLGILGGIVQTDHQIISLNGGTARTNAILGKVRAAGLLYDKTVIDGNDATKGSFLGLNGRLTGNQVITAATNGAALTLSMVDDLLDRVAGKNSEKVLVMSKADRRKLKQLVLAAASGASIMEVGRALPSYDDCPIEVLDEDGDENPILAKDETCGLSNVTSSMYCIRPGKDPEGEWVQGLINERVIDHIELPQYQTWIQDLVDFACGLGVFHGRAAARLKGIL